MDKLIATLTADRDSLLKALESASGQTFRDIRRDLAETQLALLACREAQLCVPQMDEAKQPWGWDIPADDGAVPAANVRLYRAVREFMRLGRFSGHQINEALKAAGWTGPGIVWQADNATWRGVDTDSGNERPQRAPESRDAGPATEPASDYSREAWAKRYADDLVYRPARARHDSLTDKHAEDGDQPEPGGPCATASTLK